MVQKKHQKTHKRIHKRAHRGGAIYSFDLKDKIGGLPARIPLNGTQDGDCPASDTKDLGFVNYGMTRGGGRKTKKHICKNNKRKTRKSKYKYNRK